MAEKNLVLVTGGAGFIGSHLVDALLEDGYGVRVVDNLVTGHRANLNGCFDRLEWLEGDLADFGVARAATRDVDYVFHEAAIPSVPRSIAEPLQSHASGPTATLNILEASRLAGVRRVVFAASSSAYGNTVELPKHEAMMPRPLSPYAAGKVAGELYCQVYAKSMGVDTACLRYFNIFGPRQDPGSPYSGVISLFIHAVLNGTRPVIFGDGEQTRDFTYVANAVRANLLAMHSPDSLYGEPLNVGTGCRISLVDLVRELNELAGTSLEPEFRPDRPGDVKDSLASLDRIESRLGYTPIVEFREGLRQTFAWAQLQHRNS